VKIVIFGLTISSSWGNGHATLWRGLVGALVRMGHNVVFFERDTPYYAGARDLDEISGGRLVIYPDWPAVRGIAAAQIADADVAVVTSYCADSLSARDLIVECGRPLAVFYDLDSPVTLARIEAGEDVSYIGQAGLSAYDLVLSFCGGPALDLLATRLGARRTAPLYGHVDPDVHRPAQPAAHYRCALSYLGTYSSDRQARLERLFIEPARVRGDLRFLIGGAQYPADFPWSPNIYFVRHLPPAEHPAFFSSSRLTLNITRRAMAELGWCPSGRLFEAAACGVPMISDDWPGLGAFFRPEEEIIIAGTIDDTLAALALGDDALASIARRARERALADHSSARRAAELVALLETARHHPAPPLATMEA
jgi:spore maturation protein CgeB